MRLNTVLAIALLFLALVCAAHADETGSATQGATPFTRPPMAVGFGIGLSPMNTYSGEHVSDSHTGFPLHFMLGVSSGDHHVFGFEALVSTFKVGEHSGSGHQGFLGMTWRRYPGKPGRSGFTALGAGLEMFGMRGYSTNSGPGLLAGIGSELGRFFDIGLYFNLGYTRDPDTVHFGVSAVLGLVMQ